jgi:nitrite reductase/ring-hydroxylating ferredoxin subunit
MIACTVHDVPLGEGRALTFDGRRVALFHTVAGWFAIGNTCPHAGGPLSDGITADCSVICPLHERRFDLATGRPLGHAGPGVEVYAVEVRGAQVHIENETREIAA